MPGALIKCLTIQYDIFASHIVSYLIDIKYNMKTGAVEILCICTQILIPSLRRGLMDSGPHKCPSLNGIDLITF